MTYAEQYYQDLMKKKYGSTKKQPNTTASKSSGKKTDESNASENYGENYYQELMKQKYGTVDKQPKSDSYSYQQTQRQNTTTPAKDTGGNVDVPKKTKTQSWNSKQAKTFIESNKQIEGMLIGEKNQENLNKLLTDEYQSGRMDEATANYLLNYYAGKPADSSADKMKYQQKYARIQPVPQADGGKPAVVDTSGSNRQPLQGVMDAIGPVITGKPREEKTADSSYEEQFNGAYSYQSAPDDVRALLDSYAEAEYNDELEKKKYEAAAKAGGINGASYNYNPKWFAQKQTARDKLAKLGYNDEQFAVMLDYATRKYNAEQAEKLDTYIETGNAVGDMLVNAGINAVIGMSTPIELADVYASAVLTGENVDLNSPKFLSSIATEKAADEFKGRYDKKVDLPIFGEVDLYDKAYDTTYSIVQSQLAGMMTPSLGLVDGIGANATSKIAQKLGSMVNKAINAAPGSILTLGGQSGVSTARNATANGISADNALLTGIGAAVFEGTFEAFSLGEFTDLLTKETGAQTVKQFIKNTMISAITNEAVINGSEEMFTEVANIIWDYAVNGDNSDFSRMLLNYQLQGYSYDEAKKKVFKDLAAQTAEAGIGGLIQGAIMGGGAAVTNKAVNTAENAVVNSKIGDDFIRGTLIQSKDTDGEMKELNNVRANYVVENNDNKKVAKTQAKIDKNEKKGKSTTLLTGRLARQTAEAIDRKTENTFFKGTQSIDELNERYRELQNDYREGKISEDDFDDISTQWEGLVSYFQNLDAVESRVGTVKTDMKSREAAKTGFNGFEQSGDTVLLKSENGETVSLKDAKFSNPAQKALYEAAVRTGNAETAQHMVDHYDPSMEVSDYVKAYQAAMVAGRTVSAKTYSNFLMQRNALGGSSEKTAILNAETIQQAIDDGFRQQKFNPGVLNLTTRRPTFEKKLELIAFNEFAKQNGISIIYTDTVSADGKMINGVQIGGTNAIVVAADAEGNMSRVVGHEVFHFIKENNTEGAAKIQDVVFTALENQNVKIKDRLAFYETQGYKDPEKQIDELVADSMFDVFNRETINELIRSGGRELTETLADKIAKAITQLERSLRDLEIQNKNALEISKLRNDVEALKKIRDLFFEALDDINSQKAEAEGLMEQAGITVDESTGDMQYSVRYVLDEKQRDKVATEIASRRGDDINVVKNWIDNEQSLANIILNPQYFLNGSDLSLLDYYADKDEQAIKKNSDFTQGTVDFGNNCPKRRNFTEVLNRIFQQVPNFVYTPDDLADIRRIMIKNKVPVACGICYVEDRRQRGGYIAQEFIDSLENFRNGIMTRPDSAGHINAGKNFGKGQIKAFNISKSSTYTPTIGELLSEQGLRNLKAENPDIYKTWVTFNNARGMASERLILPEAEYKREILKYSQKQVQKKNAQGGLRIFSFSDFEMFHLIDVYQVITDCAAKGLKIQGYTKVPAFARMVMNTGMKLNLSLIPAGDLGYHMEGNKVVLDYDRTEGIDIDDPDYKAISRDNPNVGNIVIGINDTQIRAAMSDGFIDYIIPFHTGQSESVLKRKGIDKWENYKDYQTEKNADGTSAGTINIYTDVLEAAEKEGKPIRNRVEFVEKFLSVCKENGLTPRFAQFLNKDANGNYIYTAGYEKMLLDFKMFDSEGNILPQGLVTPNFDLGFMEGLLEGYGNLRLKQAQDIESKMPAVIKDVMNEVVGDRAENGNNYSTRIASDTEYMELAKEPEKNRARLQEMVQQAAKSAGYNYHLYHGTNAQFTVFNTTENGGKNGKGEGYGIYLASNKEISDAYGSRVIDSYVKFNRLAYGDKKTITLKELTKLVKASCEQQAQEYVDNEEYDSVDDAILDTWVSNYVYTYGYGNMSAVYEDVAKTIFNSNSNDGDIINEVMAASGNHYSYKNANKFYNELLTPVLGIDGFVYKWTTSDVYLAFNSSQIKSADPVTYDDSGNIIPLSERFNADNPDIRYSTRLSEPTAADYAFLNEKRSRPSVQERYAATMRQYRALQAQISKAKKELGTAGQHILSEKALDMFAKKVKKDSQTTMTMDELKERLQAIYDYTVVNDTDTVKEFSESVLYNAVYELASDMLKQAEMTKAERLAVDFGEEGLVDALNNIESMRGKSVLISNEMHNVLNSGKAGFDSYADFKKSMPGIRFTINEANQDAMPWETFYSSVTDGAEYIYNQMADNIGVNADTDLAQPQLVYAVFAAATEPVSVYTDDGYTDIASATDALTMDIMDNFFNLPEMDIAEMIKREKKNANDMLAEKDRRMIEQAKRMNSERRDAVSRAKAEIKAKLDDERKATGTERLQKNKALSKLKQTEKTLSKTARLLKRSEELRIQSKDTQNRKAMRESIIKKVKKLDTLLRNPTDMRHIPENLRKSVKDFVAMFTQDTSVFNQDKLALLATYYEDAFKGNKNTGADESGSYDDSMKDYILELARLINGKRLSQLNEAETRSVKNIVDAVYKAVSDENKRFYGDKSERISDIGDKALELQSKLPPQRKGYLERKVGDAVIKLKFGNMLPDSFFQNLQNEELYKMFKALRQGQTKAAKNYLKGKEKFDSIAEKYHFYKWRNNKIDCTVEGDKTEMKIGLALSLYATYKREKNIGTSHILTGGIKLNENMSKQAKDVNKLQARKITVSELQNIFDKLTDEQKAYADEVVEYLSTDMSELGNEVSLAMFGYKKYEEDYYFPISSNPNEIFFKEGLESDRRMKHASHTHAINANANNSIIINDFTEIAFGHVKQMCDYNALVLPLEDFRRVYNYKNGAGNSLRDAIEATYGADANKYIEEFLKNINGGAMKDRNEAVFDKLLSKFKKNAVVASTSVTIQQPMAVVRAMAYIDPKYFISSSFRNFSVEKADGKLVNKSYNELMQYSGNAILKEIGGYDTSTSAGVVEWMIGKTNRNKALQVYDKVNDVLGAAPQLADKITWAHIWEACKKEAFAQYKNTGMTREQVLEKAGERFDYVTDKTQVYDSVFMNTPWMASKSLFMKSLTSFRAEPTKTANMVFDSVFGKNRKNGPNKARVLASCFFSIAITNLAKAVITASRDDDDDKTWLEKWLAGAVSGTVTDIFGLVPLMDFVTETIQGYDDETILSQTIGAGVNAITGMVEALVEDDRKKIINSSLNLGDTLGLYIGIPFKNIRREGKMVMNIVNNAKRKAAGESQKTTGQGIIQAILDSVYINNKQVFSPTDSERIYNDIVNGNRSDYDRMEAYYTANEKSFDSAIVKSLKENEPKVVEAAVSLATGDTETYESVLNELEDGFGKMNTSDAIKYMQGQIQSAATAIDQGDADGVDEALKNLTMSGYDTEAIQNAIDQTAPKLTKEKYKRIFNDDTVKTTIADSNESLLGDMYQEFIEQAEFNGKYGTEATEAADKKMVSLIKDAYKEGGMSWDTATMYLNRYGDFDENALWNLRNELEYEGEGNYSKYGEFKSAFESGDYATMAQEGDMLIEHGVDAGTMRGEITKAAKNTYIELYYSDPAAAKEMKEELIELYVRFGIEGNKSKTPRQKASENIDKWLN